MQAQYRISRHQEAQTVQVDAPAVEAPGLHWVDLSLPLSQHLIPRQALPASRVLADSPGLPPPAPTEGWGRAGSTPAPAGQARALNPCTTLCCCRKQNSEWKPDLVSTPQLPAILTRFLVKKKKNPRTTAKGPWDKGPKMARRGVQGLERPQITLKCRQFFTNRKQTHEVSYRKFYPSPPGHLSREQRAFLGVHSRVLAAVGPLMVGEQTSTKHLP